MVKKVYFIVIVLTLLSISACVTEGADPKERAYDQDGLLGITNTNPNLPTSPTHYHYKNDLELMESTLQQIHGVLSHRIMINGGNVHVHIQIPEGLNRDEVAIIEGEVYNALTFQVPKYQFILEVEI